MSEAMMCSPTHIVELFGTKSWFSVCVLSQFISNIYPNSVCVNMQSNMKVMKVCLVVDIDNINLQNCDEFL